MINHFYYAKVVNVVDGDTVDALVDLGFSNYQKIRFRLLGINAPETRLGINTTIEEKRKGIAVKDWLESILLDRDVVVYSQKTGKFGRYLAAIYVELSLFEQVEIIPEGVKSPMLAIKILNCDEYVNINEYMIETGKALPY